MRKLYAEGAIELLPAGSGFVFSVRQAVQEDKMIIAYKMYSLTTGTMAPITRSVFLHTKFGEGYKKFEKSRREFLACRTAMLPGEELLVVFESGAAAIFRGDEPVWQGDVLYRGSGPSDVVCDGEALWFCFPEGGAVVKYALRNMREELRIGGGASSAFDGPRSIWIEDEKMRLCNTNTRKIQEIDLKSFLVTDYAAFEEPVHQYLKVGANEIVLLDSGIYRL